MDKLFKVNNTEQIIDNITFMPSIKVDLDFDIEHYTQLKCTNQLTNKTKIEIIDSLFDKIERRIKQ